eukprot:10354162-Lingulodinium_polyedra.AAC.1
MKLWLEMMHVWGIEAAVLFHPGSGRGLLAFVLERKRAVGIMKNAKHKEFVKQNLAQAVKTLGLAPDRRPAKPAELAAWETVRAIFPPVQSLPQRPQSPRLCRPRARPSA